MKIETIHGKEYVELDCHWKSFEYREGRGGVEVRSKRTTTMLIPLYELREAANSRTVSRKEDKK